MRCTVRGASQHLTERPAACSAQVNAVAVAFSLTHDKRKLTET